MAENYLCWTVPGLDNAAFKIKVLYEKKSRL
jgi:hypothetical protein